MRFVNSLASAMAKTMLQLVGKIIDQSAPDSLSNYKSNKIMIDLCNGLENTFCVKTSEDNDGIF